MTGGSRRTVFFELKTNPHEPWLAKLLDKSPSCDLLDGIAGEYSLFSRFRFTDDEHLSRVLKTIDDAMGESHFKKYRVVNAIRIFKEAGVAFKSGIERKELELDEIDLAAEPAVDKSSDRVGADLPGDIHLDGRVDGDHVVVAGDVERMIDIVGRMGSMTGLLSMKL
jgi:hypothetical protein